MTPSPVCPLVEKVHVSVITSTQLLKRNLSHFMCKGSWISYLAATDNIYEPCILIQMDFSFQGLAYTVVFSPFICNVSLHSGDLI